MDREWAARDGARAASVALGHRSGEVAELGEPVLVGRRPGDDEAVLIGRRRRLEGRQALRLEPLAQLGRGRGGVGRGLAGSRVHELEGRRRVLGEDVDLAGLEGREDDLAVAQLELALDGEAVRLEDLGVELAEDLLLVEVRRADGDLLPGAGRAGGEAEGGEPGLRGVGRVDLVDGDLLVEVGQGLLGQLRAQLVEDRRHLGRRIEDLPAEHRHEVVGELQALVVLEEDEVVDGDRRVGREEQPDVDAPVLDRGDGDRAARVERLELLEREPVRLLQPDRAERALRALGRTPEDQVARDRAAATPTRRARADEQREERRPEGSPADAPHGFSFLVPPAPGWSPAAATIPPVRDHPGPAAGLGFRVRDAAPASPRGWATRQIPRAEPCRAARPPAGRPGRPRAARGA